MLWLTLTIDDKDIAVFAIEALSHSLSVYPLYSVYFIRTMPDGLIETLRKIYGISIENLESNWHFDYYDSTYFIVIIIVV